MATYIVSYDLRGTDDTSENYKKLIAKIKSYNSWARPMYSDWVVETSKSPAAVRDDLWAYMHKDDRLLVAAIGAPAAWQGTVPGDVSTWLKDHLK